MWCVYIGLYVLCVFFVCMWYVYVCACVCGYTCTLRMLHNVKLHSFCTGRPPAGAPYVHCFLSGDPADGKLPHCPKHETVDGCTARQAGIVSVGGGRWEWWGVALQCIRNI